MSTTNVAGEGDGELPLCSWVCEFQDLDAMPMYEDGDLLPGWDGVQLESLVPLMVFPCSCWSVLLGCSGHEARGNVAAGTLAAAVIPKFGYSGYDLKLFTSTLGLHIHL